MTHGRNKKHLPPRKSAGEYEVELAKLKELLEDIYALTRLPHKTKQDIKIYLELYHFGKN